MSKQAEATTLVDDVIRAAAHLEPELEEALNEHGLTRPSYLVLLALLGAEDDHLTQRELMASVKRTSGTMSVRLARLERAGYVDRERDPDDRRGAIVTLTDGGRERVEGARPAFGDPAARLAAGVPGPPAPRTRTPPRGSPPACPTTPASSSHSACAAGWGSSSPMTGSRRASAWPSRRPPSRSGCGAPSGCPSGTACSCCA